MSRSEPGFFTEGGTLRLDAPSYVERQADADLCAGLTAGEFCYVLTSRQMGKSSLMVRTAGRLRSQGTKVVVLDLTSIGRNLTPEQWYEGLLLDTAEQLGLEDEILAFWGGSQGIGPLKRWMRVLHEVVLPRFSSPVVLFLDEIDAVRSLPFSTDEFFAGIRECYTRRATHPEMNRLTFCLVGVASPSDLIQDTRTTPFNIGRRIELRDLGPEAIPALAKGLPGDPKSAHRAVERILHWTGGHPYLTQRLCAALARGLLGRRTTAQSTAGFLRRAVSVSTPAEGGSSAHPLTASAVDALCHSHFLSAQARERDDNLIFVRERLLRSEAEPAALLDLYGHVRRGARVEDDETNALVSVLRLSGVTRAERGRLVVRNAIYERVFDLRWVRENMPDAELRRQRTVYRRGLSRALMGAAGVLVVVGGLALSSLHLARERSDALFQARQDRLTAEAARDQAEMLQYSSDVRLAQQSWESGNLKDALDLLESHDPRPGRPDLRSFDWRYLWRLCHSDESLLTVRCPQDGATGLAISPDGTLAAAAERDSSVALFRIDTGAKVAELKGHHAAVRCAAFSADGAELATGDASGSIALWSVAGRRRLRTLSGAHSLAVCLAFAPKRGRLASTGPDGSIRVWDLSAAGEVSRLLGKDSQVNSVAFSPDAELLVSCGAYQTLIWDVRRGRRIDRLGGEGSWTSRTAWSPDGRTIAIGNELGVLRLWDRGTGRAVAIKAHDAPIHAIAFSHGGRLLATGGADAAVRIWDPVSGRNLALLRGSRASVYSLAFRPGDSRLVSGTDDGLVKVWPSSPMDGTVLGRYGRPITATVFTPDGRFLATAGVDGQVLLRDVTGRLPVAVLRRRAGVAGGIAVSPDGRLLAFSAGDVHRAGSPGIVELWDLRGVRRVSRLTSWPDASTLVFSPGGQLLAVGDKSGLIRVCRVERETGRGGLRVRLREVTRLETHDGEMWTAAFSPDGTLLACSSRSTNDILVGRVKIWDLRQGRLVAALDRVAGWEPTVAFSPSGKQIACGVPGGGLQLWNLEPLRATSTLDAGSEVHCVSYSSDGKCLAAGMANGTIKFWSLPSQEQTLLIDANVGFVDSVCLSENYLASGGVDGVVRLWRASSRQEVRKGDRAGAPVLHR